MWRATGAVGGIEVGAMLAEEGDDLELLLERASRTAGTRGLRGQVEGRGTACSQPTIGPRSEGEQTVYSHGAPCPDGSVKRGSAASIGVVQVCAT
jgi:hypothetical protein